MYVCVVCVCSDAWLSFLQLPIPADLYRKVLLRLHSHVMPHLPNPLLLSDFLTFSLDQGGLTGEGQGGSRVRSGEVP